MDILVLLPKGFSYYVFVLVVFSVSNMKACKEELHHLRTMIESMPTSSRSYTLSNKVRVILLTLCLKVFEFLPQKHLLITLRKVKG